MELHELTLSRKVRTPAEQAMWVGGALARYLADNSGALVATGSSNAFAVTTAQAFTAYFDGLAATFEANHSITGAATLDINGIGAAALRKDGTAALVSGDIVSGQRVQVVYDGANFQILSRTVQQSENVLTTEGDVLYRNATVPARLAIGTAGQSLVTNSGATAPEWASVPTQATEQATTSGTAFDFGSVPSWVTKITIVFNEVSLSGTDALAVQIGDSGGLETTGYVASASSMDSTPTIAVVSSTTNFPISFGLETRAFSGHMILTAVDSDRLTWISSHSGKLSTTVTAFGGGSKTLSAGLDRLRITRSGTDTFDAGSVNIIYE